MVANVIINRVQNDAFPDTVTEVIFQRENGVSQFSPIRDGRFYQVSISDETVEAVEAALYGQDESQGALYFMARKYDASDIDILETDRDRVQQQAHIYIPDKRLAGALHIIREVIDNPQDEVMNSSGEVIVTFDEVTRECTVKDNGRGIPLEKLQELCEVLNSSGKFNKGKNNAYLTAGGLHGIGLKLANFLSEYFEITVERDGKLISRYYEDGIFIKEKKEKSDNHGTFIRLKLSDKYLKDLEKMKCKHIQKMIEEKTDACPGLVTTFKGIGKDGKKIKEKYSGLTIKELMKKYMKPTSKTWEFEFESKDGNSTAKLAFGYDSKATEGSNLMGWTNFIYNKDGGTHVDAISDALFDVFRRYMLNNFFTDKEKKNLQIRREDIKLGLCGVVVLLTTTPEFLGRTILSTCTVRCSIKSI